MTNNNSYQQLLLDQPSYSKEVKHLTLKGLIVSVNKNHFYSSTKIKLLYSIVYLPYPYSKNLSPCVCGILNFERSLLPSQSGQCPGK